mgnify:CR=1 FL=1
MSPNKEEQYVIDNLTHQGYVNILYEPDGNVPPDILVDGNIAIEVRRLNQNQKTKKGFKGLEQEDFSIRSVLSKMMRKVSDKNYEKSAFVGYYFSRPIPSKKVIKKFTKKILENHKFFMSERKFYEFSEYFKLEIYPSEIKLDQQYEYGMSIDENSGGFVVNSIYENLKFIIAEKEEKTRIYRSKYAEYWLAVVDTIGYGLSDLELIEFNNIPKIESQFDRLLLISANDYKSFRYLYE